MASLRDAVNEGNAEVGEIMAACSVLERAHMLTLCCCIAERPILGRLTGRLKGSRHVPCAREGAANESVSASGTLSCKTYPQFSLGRLARHPQRTQQIVKYYEGALLAVSFAGQCSMPLSFL